MTDAGMIFLRLMGVWALAAVILGLHGYRSRYSRHFLYVLLGGLAVFNLLQIALLGPLVTIGVVTESGAIVGSLLSPRMIMPAIYFAVLIIYASEGTLQAALLLPGIFLASLVGGLFLPFVFTAGVPLVDLVFTDLTKQTLGMALRQQVAELSTFMLGVYVLVVLYQVLANHVARKRMWLAGSAAMLITGWTHAVIFAVGAHLGGQRWALLLGADLAGWTLSMLALCPWVLLYFIGREHVRGGLLQRVDDHRPALDVVRDTLALQHALQRKERRISRLDGMLELMTGVRVAIQFSQTPSSLMQRIAHLLVDTRAYSRVWIGLLADRDGELEPVEQASAQQAETGGERWWARVSLMESQALRQAFRTDARMLRVEREDQEAETVYPSSASIPMRVDADVIGIMVVHTSYRDTLDEEELRLLKGIAESVGHGLGSMRKESQHIRALKELDAIRGLVEEMISQPGQARFLHRTLEQAVLLLNADCGWIYLVSESGHAIRCYESSGTSSDWSGEMLRFGEGAAGTVAKQKAPLLIEDYPSWSGRIPRAQAEDIHATLGVPMLWLGDLRGILLVARRHEQPVFSQSDEQLLQLFANQATMVFENAQLVQAAQQRARQLGALNDLTSRALSASSLPELAQASLGALGSALGLQSCGLAVFHPDDARIRALVLSKADHDRPNKLEVHGKKALVDLSLLEEGAAKPLRKAEQLVALRNDLVEALDADRVLMLPLDAGGKRQGLVLWGSKGNVTDEDWNTCQQATGSLALALANVQAFEKESKRRDVLEALRQASLRLTSSLELRPVLEAILEQTLALVDADDAHVFLYEEQALSFGAARWRDGRALEPFSEPRVDGLTSTVARLNERIVIPNVNESALFADWQWGGAIVGMPLRIGQNVVGVMNVAMDAPHDFSEDELRSLELLADQASIALHNARLFERIDADRMRVRLLYEVSRDIASSLNEDEILRRALELTVRELHGLQGAAFILDPKLDRIALKVLAQPLQNPLESLDLAFQKVRLETTENWVAETHQPILLQQEDLAGHWSWYQQGLDMRAAMCVPIQAGEEFMGVFSLVSHTYLHQEQLDLFSAISRQVGLALSNARKYRQAERRLAELDAVRHVARMISSRVEMEPLLNEVVRQAHQMFGYEIIEIFLLEQEALVRYAAHGGTDRAKAVIAADTGIIGRVVRSGEAAFVPDVTLESDYRSAFPNTRAEIAVPLSKGGQLVGVMNVETTAEAGLDRDDLRLLTLLADQVSVALENASLYEQLRKHTIHLEQTVAERTAALAKALEQAREADRLKTQFVADVSHELRTPLTNIRLYLELLNFGNPKRAADYLDTLSRETDRLVALIEDLLAISRLDVGTSVPELQSLNLNDLAASLVEDRRRLLGERKLKLNFEPEEDLPRVKADEGMISQVLANLVTNAMNYTPAGGQIAICTQTQVHENQSWVTLSVKDTGVGIPENEQGRVFERFFRGAASRDVGIPGTGLGLAISQEILDRHGGRIEMRSTPNVGSCFTLWLPVSKDWRDDQMEIWPQQGESGR